jgi:hypothetical protein
VQLFVSRYTALQTSVVGDSTQPMQATQLDPERCEFVAYDTQMIVAYDTKTRGRVCPMASNTMHAPAVSHAYGVCVSRVGVACGPEQPTQTVE